MRARVEQLLWHPAVEAVISLSILANSVLVGVEVDWTVNNPNEKEPIEFMVIGYIFSVIFAFEWFARVFALGMRFLQGKQMWWNIFDTWLVLSSFLEVAMTVLVDTGAGNVYSIRLVRLFRISRILRVIRVARVSRLLTALRLIVIQIIGTLRACFWALALLVLIMYTFGMVFAQVIAEYSDLNPELYRYWGSVTRAMYTLYKCVTGGLDWEHAANPLSDVSWALVAVFNVYMAFTLFAVMNTVVGVFCQSAIESAKHDYENTISVKMREKEDFTRKIRQLFQEIDVSGDGSLSYDEFKTHLQNDKVIAYFEHLGLDPADAWDLFKVLDTDGSDAVDREEFVTGCLRLKGFAKVMDIEKLQYENKHMRSKMWESMKHTADTLARIEQTFLFWARRSSMGERHSSL